MSAWGKAFGFAWGNSWGAVGGVVLRAELRKADGRRWRFEPVRAALLSPALRRRVAVADWRPRGRAEARRWLIRG